MKFLRLISILLFSAAVLQAQVPRAISYQGILTDPAGNFIPDGNHTLTLKLYDNIGAATPIYTENQAVPVVKGLFNAIIGSVTPLPSSLAFDRAYFLGVSVDGGIELAPRTPLTAVPYALRAAVADVAQSLAPTATGVVTSVNSQSGALTLQGGGGTTITNSGSTITISSTGGGGTGIQGVQNSDGSLTITNPNGPTATINVTNGAITNPKLGAGAVTGDKIQDGTITAADLAAGVIPTSLPPNGAAGGDLTGSYPNPAIAAGAVTTAKILDGAVTGAKIGTGAVGTPQIVDGAVTTDKISNGVVTPAKINTIGSLAGQVLTSNGSAVSWQSPSGGGGLTLPYAGSNASGATTTFQVTNTATTGTGAALTGKTNSQSMAADAIYGEVSSLSPADMSAAVHGKNKGAGPSGIGVYGEQAGSGWGVAGITENGTGVYASVNSGGYAMYAYGGGSGQGIFAFSQSSNAGNFVVSNPASSASALLISNGGTANALEVHQTLASSSSAAVNVQATGASGSAGVRSVTTATDGAGLHGISNTGLGALGVLGESSSGYGVKGVSTGFKGVGVYGECNNGSTAAGMFGASTSGYGMRGYSTAAGAAGVFGQSGNVASPGVLASNQIGGAAPALQIDNGYIKVSGASKTAFVHTVTAGNTSTYITRLSYPGMSSTDMVIATHVYISGYTKGGYSVWWDGAEWTIYNDDTAVNMTIGDKFNVLVIKQ